LLEKGCKVKALAYYNSFNTWDWLEDVQNNGNLEVISGDIRDPHICKEAAKGNDIIFHLAALIAFFIPI
jgi:nucleoside-diphosphate-sugar epimerase